MPVLTKDVALIWWGNAMITLLCYLYAFSRPANDDTIGDYDKRDENQMSGFDRLFMKAIKALDYGSGQERGLRQ